VRKTDKDQSVKLNQIFKTIRKEQLEKCPDSVVRNVYRKIGISQESSRENQGYRFRTDFGWKLSFVTVFCAVIIGSLIHFGDLRTVSTGYEQNYSSKDIQIAEHQLKKSLALVHRISRRSSEMIPQDVLAKSMISPVKKSIQRTFDSLKGEKL